MSKLALCETRIGRTGGGVVGGGGGDLVELDQDAGVVGVVGSGQGDAFRQFDVTAVYNLDLKTVRVELCAHDIEGDVEAQDLDRPMLVLACAYDGRQVESPRGV